MGGFAQSFYKNVVSLGSMLVALASFEKAKADDTEKAGEPVLEISHGSSHWRGKHYPNRRRPMSAAFKRQIAKERDIGVDPKYLNGSRAQRASASEAWQPISREWDRKHPVGRHG